jgi:uncharacterized surface protein with fasciclin (FAS1) repeats
MSSRNNRRNIVTTAVDDGRFQTLVTALQQTGLDRTLRQAGPYTVFAPNDQAFEGVDLDNVSQRQLKTILGYHVVAGYFPSSDLKSILRLKSVEGSPLKIRTKNGRITVNGNSVQIADVKTSNGVIHVIDTVLMP